MRQWIYLGLAAAGLVLNWHHNIAFMQENGVAFALAGPLFPFMRKRHMAARGKLN